MASVSNPDYEAGKLALNEKDYATAIAHFQGICEVELDENLIALAQQGLILAYCESGEPQKAINLCHGLTEIRDPKISSWASRTLVDLNNRFSQAKAANSSVKLKPPEEVANPQLPINVASSSQYRPSIFTPGRQWRNAEGAQTWKPMKRLKRYRLWAVEVVCGIAFFVVLRWLVELGMGAINNFLNWLPLLRPLQIFYRDPTNFLLVALGILAIAAPWLLDFLLKKFHGWQPLPITKFATQYPEVAKTLQRYCRNKKIPIPKLGILPTDIPLAVSYGNLPRTARIVVSQGLLDKLEIKEIEAIYAHELGHIIYWDFLPMSVAMLVIQLPYILYWQISQWGGKFQNKSKSPPYIPIIRGIAAIFATLFYGIYWLLKLTILWFSRRRVYYSDRAATEITGNPNALSRGLLKIAMGMAESIAKKGYTTWLLEGFDVMMPLGHKQAMGVGSFPDHTPLELVLAWECTNPYRHWLALTNSHALTGDRLYLLGRYAYFWKLQPELDLPTLTPPPKNNVALLQKIKNSYRALPILQSAIIAGTLFGLLFRGVLWIIGKIGDWLNISQLIWLYNAQFFLDACILFAFSLVTILLVNNYFPDINISPTRTEPRLQDLVTDSQALPPDSQGIQMSGKLLGREGISNWLVQDLVLATSTGLIKLHFFSKLGPLGNLLPLDIAQHRSGKVILPMLRFNSWRFLFVKRPCQLIEQNVTVTGWFRRGSTAWIDVDTIETKDGKIIRSGYPVWVTILLIIAALWGAYSIWQVGS
ncbi:MAG: M48 family metalloprotease [Spirulinaceae cyanobacterium]